MPDSFRFLIDAQLPPRLARESAAANHRAFHLEEVGLRNAADSAILNYALPEGMVNVTKDEDFIERWRRQHSGPSVVWLRIGNAANSALLTWFLPDASTHHLRLQTGDRLIEVR